MRISHQLILAGGLALVASPALAGGTWQPGDKVWGKPANAPWSECMINTVRGDAKGATIYEASCRIHANGGIVSTHEIFYPDQTRAFSSTPPAEPAGTTAAPPRTSRSSS